MRDRHRSARLDLGFELRHHRAVRSQHIAEPHGNEPRLGTRARLKPCELRVARLAIHLAEPLGRAQHGHRLDRLVGRNHHHRGSAGFDRGVRDIDRAEHVGLDRLAPVPFEHRHLLERSGMKHDVGLELAEQADDAIAVANVGQPAIDARRRALGGQHRRHRIERRLGMLHDQQPAGAKRHDAIADLRADRAAAAGHHHRLASQEILEPLIVDLDARPQQQIFDRHWRQFERLAGFVERRQPAGRNAELPRLHQDRTPRRCPARTPTASKPAASRRRCARAAAR